MTETDYFVIGKDGGIKAKLTYDAAESVFTRVPGHLCKVHDGGVDKMAFEIDANDQISSERLGYGLTVYLWAGDQLVPQD